MSATSQQRNDLAPRWWAGDSKRVSLRRGLLVLLIVALLPITVLAILQGQVRLDSRRAAVVRELSEQAVSLAQSNQTLLAGIEAVLRVSALNPRIMGVGAECGPALVTTRKVTPAIANIILYDADRRLRCAATGPTSGVYSIPDSSLWQALSRRTEPLVGDAIWGTFSKRRVMRMLLPLRDDQGRFNGAMVGAIDIAWLADRLNQSVRNAGTAVAVISDSGQVLTSSQPLPRFDTDTAPGKVARATARDGRHWSYTLVPLVPRGPDQNGIYVAYASPDPEPFSAGWWQSVFDFTLPVLTILLASLAIWAGTRRLVLRWLVALQRLALHFAGGDYRHRPVSFIDAPREIRSVAASLYRMSSAVAERDRRLREALERQRLLTREVHHRVKNNFQIVMSLLSLQSSKLVDGAARQAIDQARRRIGALALVHRLIYQSDEIAAVASRELLGAVCEQQQPRLQPKLPSAERLELHCDFDDVPLGIDQAVPLTLWLVEAINNAFHHGFPDKSGGRVDAVLRVVDGVAELNVIDDGVGFDPDSPPGDHPGGNGLKLIKAIAAQLGGTATARRRPEGGSDVTLRFMLERFPAAPEPTRDETLSEPAPLATS